MFKCSVSVSSTHTQTHAVQSHSFTEPGFLSLIHYNTPTHIMFHTPTHTHTQKNLFPKHQQLSLLCLGGPGSGKGTQSLKIAERYGFQYVSVGELLRKKMIHNATSNRKWSLIAKIITNGELAPQVAWEREGERVERGG